MKPGLKPIRPDLKKQFSEIQGITMNKLKFENFKNNKKYTPYSMNRLFVEWGVYEKRKLRKRDHLLLTI